jgi:hypothetical protein
MSSSYDERVAALRDRLDAPTPESVKFENPGEEVVGIFRQWDKGVTVRGDAWIAVLESVKVPGRLASVWVFHEALRSQLAKANPQPGDLIAIRYLGMREPAHGGESYHDYKVATEATRPTAAPPWVGGQKAEAAPLDQQPAATDGSPGAAEPTKQADDLPSGFHDAPAPTDDDIPF